MIRPKGGASASMRRSRGAFFLTARCSAPQVSLRRRYLDTLAYRDCLENLRGYDPAVTRMAVPIVGLRSGVSTDAACARLGRQMVEDPERPMAVSFPGAESPFARAWLRAMLPSALPGEAFDSLIDGPMQHRAL